MTPTPEQIQALKATAAQATPSHVEVLRTTHGFYVAGTEVSNRDAANRDAAYMVATCPKFIIALCDLALEADALRTQLAQVTQERDAAHKAVSELSQSAHVEWTRAEQATATAQALRERIAALEQERDYANAVLTCPHCDGRGWTHVISVHEASCDGSCRDCPVAEQVPCDCLKGV